MDFASPIKESILTPAQSYGLRQSTAISIIEITVTLELKKMVCNYKDDGYYSGYVWIVENCYYGKSTFRVPAKQNPEEELIKQRAKMTEEAKKAALIECFRERLGFTEFNDMVFDELHRPINV